MRSINFAAILAVTTCTAVGMHAFAKDAIGVARPVATQAPVAALAAPLPSFVAHSRAGVPGAVPAVVPQLRSAAESGDRPIRVVLASPYVSR